MKLVGQSWAFNASRERYPLPDLLVSPYLISFMFLGYNLFIVDGHFDYLHLR